MSAERPAQRGAAAAAVATTVRDSGFEDAARAIPERRRGLSRNWAAVLVAAIAACAYAAPHVTRYLEVREIAQAGQDPLRVYCAASWPSTTDFARVTICEAVASAEWRGAASYEIGQVGGSTR